MKDSATIITFPQKEKIREAAAHWIVQLDGGPLPRDKEQEFVKWLNASNLHKQEFFNLCYVWGKYDFFADLANVIELEKPDVSRTSNARPSQLAYAFVAGIIISLTGFILINHSSFRGESTDVDATLIQVPAQPTTDIGLDVAKDDTQTLEAIIDELNRELKNKIVISDEEIKDLRLNQEFSSANLQTLFQHLQNQYLISVYFSSDDRVYLSNEELRQL